MLAEQIAVTMMVAETLEALGIPYAIGGSFASALHGVMRAMMDADPVLFELETVADNTNREHQDAWPTGIHTVVTWGRLWPVIGRSLPKKRNGPILRR